MNDDDENTPADDSMPRCPTCGDYLTVWFDDRSWCVVCEADELFAVNREP